MRQKSVKSAGGGGTTPLLPADASGLPIDAPLLSIEDAATYLRISATAVRKLLDGRADSDDGELGVALRRFLVKISARRRYIAKAPFLLWLQTFVNKLNAAS